MGHQEVRAKAFDTCQRLAAKPDRVDKLIDMAAAFFAEGDEARGSLAEKWVKKLLLGVPLTPQQERELAHAFPHL